MEQYNNKNISKITNSINKNSSETTKLYIIFTIFAGILTLFPINILFSGLTDSNTYIKEIINIISFYIVKVIGFMIYFCILKKITKSKIIISIIAGISMLISGFIYNQMNNVENTGIDYIGQALVMSMISIYFMNIYYICTFILFIEYAKDFILKRKAIITIVITLFFIILFEFIMHYTSIQKINDHIPSVSDFENELIERNLYTKEYLLFGIDNIENNIHKIDFDSDSNKKYPSYIYYGYKTKKMNKNIRAYDDYLNWIIYYTNGKIYAALGNYDDSQLYQNYYSMELSYNANILSEDDEIYTYDWEKNYYEKININKDGVSREELRFYYKNGTYIAVDVLKKSSYKLYEYEILDRIDSNMLDNYANSLNK